MNLEELQRIVAAGESETIEFKRSTSQLNRAVETICAFLNGQGGSVFLGVTPEGKIAGQQVADQTLQEIAQAVERLEPPADISVRRIPVEAGREVIVLEAGVRRDVRPFTYEGRAYERVTSTTRRMPQAKYERLLLDRAHGTRRWENEPAEGVELRDIDREEAFRIVEAARSGGRLVGPVGRSLADVLDRLRVRRNGRILQAAVVLFGKDFLPDYPQCELRMARFRGLDKTEFLDQRQIRGPAFKLLEEAQLFCQRNFPLPGKIVPGRLQRVDRPLIPPDAMREILVNALIHRDYTIAGGAISLAIFDDRVEVWSAGTFPTGIRPELLSRKHDSVQRNPTIADVFHRAGLIEKWGRGTNRVIDMCREAGIASPTFEEIGGAAVVTFQVNVLGAQSQSLKRPSVEGPSRDQVGTKSGPSRDQVVILRLCRQEQPLIAMMKAVGRRNRTKFREGLVKPLIEAALLELTIPGSPKSRLQRYRTTEAGRRALVQASS